MSLRALQPEIPAKQICLSELRPLVYTMRLPSQAAVRIAQLGAHTARWWALDGDEDVVATRLTPARLCSPICVALASESPSGPVPGWVAREGFLE